ncbi:MAG: DUF4239 domain-containing protein [Candidatus Eremiobacteraeota bacterium]|nr:DUF4239 domain-containing protein [Candidatus Eremiobacteraeota bacterium]
MVQFLYSNPIWLVGLVVVAAWVVPSLIGLLVWNRFSSAEKREKDTETVGLTFAIVAVVYAVLIAFIVVDVYETFSRADEVATAEANQLSNLMFDASGLPAPLAKSIRADLDKYIDIVVKTEWPNQQNGKLDEAGFEAGWDVVADISTTLAQFQSPSLGANVNKTEMLRAVNQLIRARRTRIIAAGEHLPDIVWQILIVSGIASIFYTYLFGAHSLRLHLAIVGLISATIALAFVLIIALDYPFRGEVSVGDDAFVSMKTAAAGAFAPAPASAPK